MEKPIVLVIMDGVGKGDGGSGDAVKVAKTPTLDTLLATCPHTYLKAHGTAVGLPSDEDMGNSEVGHNALGCGQIYSQGAKLVNTSLSSGEMFKGSTWKALVENAKTSTMHFIGLLSDGNVHSNINHLFTFMEQAKKDGIKRVRIHILLDGRDVDETSALKYVDMLEKEISELNDSNFNAKIASGGGRMYITMDRYESDWKMVERGWHTHVLGDARMFDSATSAIETYRKELNVIDQNLPNFVIGESGVPVGTIEDGDSVIFFNFRGDRALEISESFDQDDFNKFDRIRRPHVMYFWNGNRTEKFNDELEEYAEVPSDVISFDKKPAMKSYEITDKLIDAIKSRKYDFLRTNFPNGDMVGHTGNYEATIKSLEAVDENLHRIIEAVKEVDGILIVLADHGNAEEMYQLKDRSKKIPKTSHTLNPVPFIIYANDTSNIHIKDGTFGLANVASTITTLMGIDANPNWLESIIEYKK